MGVFVGEEERFSFEDTDSEVLGEVSTEAIGGCYGQEECELEKEKGRG